MKRFFYIFVFILTLLISCQEDRGIGQEEKGWLSVEFLIDKSLYTRSVEPAYTLDILNSAGESVAHYDHFEEMSERILLPVGFYQLVATTGEDVLADFEKPFYKAVQEVQIESAVTKEVILVCTQANVKVTVEYSDRIRKNFTEYTLEVVNGDGELIFTKDETRAGYLRVNESTMVWNLTLNNGQEIYRVHKTVTNVAPRQYYRFSFDINEEVSEDAGAFISAVVIDTTTDVYDWLCEIVLKEDIAKPTVMRSDGIALDEPVLVLEKARGADVRLNITAQAQMQDLTIRHHSETVKGLGIPEKVTLTHVSDEVKTAVNRAGITWGDESLLDAQSATLDFSSLANALPLGNYEFFISVYDARNRLVTDTLRISVIPDIDHIADEANVLEVWAKFATIHGRWYTLERPEGLAIEYSTNQITWTPATDVAFAKESKTFSAYLTGLQDGTTYYFRTTATEKGASETIRTFTTETADQIPYMDFNSWWMDGKSPMLGESDATQYWDSGNPGGSGFGIIPTTEETSFVVKGSAAKLASTGYTLLGAQVKFAAGNIYTGKFVGLDGTDAEMDFGIPYTSRPTCLKGYYKYRPGIVNWGSHAGMSDKTDSCHIYIVLTDWSGPFRVASKTSTYVDLSEANSSIIAIGELKTDQATTGEGYVEFTIPLKYRKLDKKPTYILIVAAASKFGDYFTGSDESILWLDEFELGFDPME